ncbi:sugar transferase [Pseudonocardia sp. DSM 110487]|uniref:sugar transferase n=1 Tax=Pseudonocardia sp. DSM 110487 TaxID=2865833 RepID=UPI001C69A53D|nr:sugar transferase [Pseudonocardia sp. DSM 110487]QYN34495.1 sugar transferase [Pseudonocardia sp. DSM 110487]
METTPVSARTRDHSRARPLHRAATVTRARAHRRAHLVRSIALAMIDTAAWAFALTCALLLRYEFQLGEIDPGGLLRIGGIAVVAQLLCGGIIQFYRPFPIGSFDDVADVARSMLVVGVLLFVTNVVVSPLIVPRTVPLIALPIAIMATVGLRGTIRSARVRALRRYHQGSRRAILLGAGADGPHLVRSMLEHPDRNLLPVALLDDDTSLLQQRFDGVPVHGTKADIETAAARFRADMLLIVGPLPARVDRSVVDAATRADLQIVHVPPLTEIFPSAGTRDGTSVNGLHPHRVRQRGKRTLDVLLCILALPIVLPVCLLIAIVLAVGQGEVLYCAQRIGRDGRQFTMLKFATMRPGDSGPRVTRERDPRITPIGRWLRATKLNELPQVFNVVKGDMSIVGPRPEDPRYAASFTPEQTEVLRVRPGLTGLAYLEFGDEQAYIESVDPADIEAYYVRELLPEKLRIELRYLETWSVARDLAIIARTATRLFSISGGPHG